MTRPTPVQRSRWAFGLLFSAVLLLPSAARALQPPQDDTSRSGVQTTAFFEATELRAEPSLQRYPMGSKQAAQLLELQAFFASHSRDWDVLWDERADRPHLIQGAGIPLIPGKGNRLSRGDVGLGAYTVLKTADIEPLLRGFMDQHPELFRIDQEDLVLDESHSVVSGKDQYFWSIELQQTHRGVPVEGAHVYFRVNHGNIVQFGNTRIADVTLDATPRLSRSRATRTALRSAGFRASEVSEWLQRATLKIYPVLDDAETVGEPFAGQPGDGYRHRLVWEMSFRRTGDMQTYKAVVDAHDGQLLELTDINAYATVTGGIYPVTNTDPEVISNFGFATVTNNGTKFTNSAGVYSYTSGTATVTLNGQYFQMSDACGSITLSNSVDGNINFGTSGGTDCTTPGFGGAGNTHASRSGFFHLTNINRKAITFLPGNGWLGSKVVANMNINLTCNAFWNGSSVNFYRSGGGCANTGELAAVFLHEWGHGMDTNSGGSASNDQGTGEAVGDTFAFLETKNSCIGHNFLSTPCANCGTCTGVRNVASFALGGNATIARPSTVTDNAGINCDRFLTTSGAVNCPYRQNSGTGALYRGPMGYEGHCESYIASSANWDLAQSLVAEHGTTAGWAAMDKIRYASLTPSKSAYRVVSGGTCNPNAVVDGCGAQNWYTVFLPADDNDGNLANGTPNACRIWAAFNAHGIACGAQPVCSGPTPTPTPTTPPAPTNTPTPVPPTNTPAPPTNTPTPVPPTNTPTPVPPTNTPTPVPPTNTPTNTPVPPTATPTSPTGGDLTALYDSTLRAPKCGTVGKSCDSGTLVNGRDGKGPEPNASNTINASCTDGTTGTYHVDESTDRLKVSTVDGTNLGAGKSVRIDATVWAYSSFTADKLDLYYAANANSPTWVFIGTITPTGAGVRTLSATYTLPSGSLQAVRAQFRYQGSAGTCSTGGYNDRDDLIFAVQ